MNVLLIGASGLLGHNVLRRLIDCGHQVCCIVRRSGAIRLPNGGWSEAIGNPADAALLDSVMPQCQAVINCAAATDMSMRRLQDYVPANVDLPRALVQAMERCEVKRMVHISTVNTIGHTTPSGAPATEDEPVRAPFASSLYAQSKALGEGVVIEAARRHPDWHVVVINAGYMLGAYDIKPSSGKMLDAAYGRRVMLAPQGGKSFVAVGDVAVAAIAATERGNNGERYIVVGQSMSIADLYRLQAQVVGRPQRVLPLPRWVAAVGGAVGDALRWLGVGTQLSSNNVAQLQAVENYSSARAQRELGLQPTAIEQAIKEYHIWKGNITD